MLENKKPAICVLDSGFVYVGLPSLEEGHIKIERAYNIRRWGTSKGIGELALHGPTRDTILDPVGTVLAPYPHKINHIIPLSKESTESFKL